MNMNYNAADYLMDDPGHPSNRVVGANLSRPATGALDGKQTSTGSVNQRRPGKSSGRSGDKYDNYNSPLKDLEGRDLNMYDGQGTPMSDPDQEDQPGYNNPIENTPSNPPYNPNPPIFANPIYPDPSPPLNPPMDVPHNLPPFPPMNFPPFPPMPPQIPQIDFKPMEMPERKPYGFASVDSRAAGYSQNLPGQGTLRDKVLGTVGRSPLQNALQ